MLKKTSTLADKVAGILSTAPISFDPDTDNIDITTAQLVPKDFEDSNEQEEEILSKFRTENSNLLSEVDNKYAGNKVSRKIIQQSSEQSESDDSNELESTHEESDILEGDSEDGETESDEKSISEDDVEGEEESDNSSQSEETNFKHINDVNVSNQVQKANCVRNQMVMWESLLEIRIQLQKCLLNANKIPSTDDFKELKQQLGQEFTNKVAETKNVVSGVLDNLLSLQQLVLKRYPETKKLYKNKAATDNDDEEILSETESEQSISQQSEKNDRHENTQERKRKLSNYENELSDNHKLYKSYRNNVIQKWNDKTRVAVMKSNSASHTVLNQIEYNLSNKDKLIKKTQYDKNLDEYKTEIFDDTDFYHKLLRELIEVKSADITDPVQLGRQWVQLQSLRSKMKRKIDTKATKGRKMRYAVHNKLVNFMAPIENNQWSDEAKTDLYNSLFGKNLHVLNV